MKSGHSSFKVLGFLGALVFSLISLNASAVSLRNAGAYISPSSAKAGDTVTFVHAVMADEAVSNAIIQTEIRLINAAGVIESPSLLTTRSSYSFRAGEQHNFTVTYSVPSNVVGGTYSYVLTAISADQKSIYYQTAEKVAPYILTLAGIAPTPTPAPVVTTPTSTSNVLSSANYGGLRNAGAYNSPTSAKAGNSVTLVNALYADYAISNATIKTEIHALSSSGAMTSTVVASQTYSNQTFRAGEQKNYTSTFVVPSTLANGTYSNVVIATSSSGGTYFTLAESGSPYIFSVSGNSSSSTSVTTGNYKRGINIMDLAISDTVLPGVYNTHYTRPSLGSLQSLAGRGYNVIRLPFLWERVQPSLGGSLNSAYMGLIISTLKDANSAGLKVILDMHNYARYHVNGSELLMGKGFSTDQFADAWKKISAALRADGSAYDAVYAYDLMNEPHDLDQAQPNYPAGLWVKFAQAAVTGIRSLGDTKLIMVEGYGWASGAAWPDNHPNKFIADSAGNTMYQAHIYMDANAGGIYNMNFDQETASAKASGFASVADQALYRAKRFAEWCSREQVKCFVGEYGWANANVVGSSDAAKWNAVGEIFLSYLDSMGLGATAWATGSWLSPTDNVLNAYQLQGTLAPLSQASVMERHLGR